MSADLTNEPELPQGITPDPIKRGAELIAGEPCEVLERRLKRDIFDSLCRIKPELASNDFEETIMSGKLFEELSAPLQGIAIARVEGSLAFYNRIGWNESFLEQPLTACITEETALATLGNTYHARNLHDLGYVHPKHFEKIFGKAGAAAIWEELKRHSGKEKPA